MIPRLALVLLTLLPFFLTLASATYPDEHEHDEPRRRKHRDPHHRDPPRRKDRRHRRRNRDEHEHHNPCSSDYRTIDGSCTSAYNPHWGRANEPEFSYFASLDARYPNGNLPSAREISNLLCDQRPDESVPSETRLSDFSTFFSQFLDHDFGVTLENKNVSLNIVVPDGDRHFADVSFLTFHRSVTKPVSTQGGRHPYRPVNLVTPAADLSNLYGSDAERARVLRAGYDGLLKHSSDDLLQSNTYGIRNAPRPTADFFLSGDHRANEHPMLTILHIVFSREHNRLAREILDTYGHWDDEEVFQAARAINIAQWQRIVWTEYYPAMLGGRRLARYRGHSRTAEPSMSVVFSTAAFRVGHSMVNEAILSQKSSHGPVTELPILKAFFQPTTFLRTHGIETFLRPTFSADAQQIDLKVVHSLRNALFRGIDGQTALDLASNNIQRGRDHGLPTYNEVRQKFGLRPARKFSDIAKDRGIQARLRLAYGSVNRVELWPGLLAEPKKRGHPLGKTTEKIWRAEFSRLRDGDRFFYENGFGPLADDLRWIRSAELSLEGRVSLRDILIRNTELTELDVPRDIWHAGH